MLRPAPPSAIGRDADQRGRRPCGRVRPCTGGASPRPLAAASGATAPTSACTAPAARASWRRRLGGHGRRRLFGQRVRPVRDGQDQAGEPERAAGGGEGQDEHRQVRPRHGLDQHRDRGPADRRDGHLGPRRGRRDGQVHRLLQHGPPDEQRRRLDRPHRRPRCSRIRSERHPFRWGTPRPSPDDRRRLSRPSRAATPRVLPRRCTSRSGAGPPGRTTRRTRNRRGDQPPGDAFVRAARRSFDDAAAADPFSVSCPFDVPFPFAEGFGTGVSNRSRTVGRLGNGSPA